MKRTQAELYISVMNEVNCLIGSLGEITDDKEVLEQQNQAKKKLDGIHIELQASLEHLEKNAEWDLFTIAFYGETNAGKSTLIETLRILLSDPSKIEEQEMFRSASLAIEQIETKLRQSKDDLNQVNMIFEKNTLHINGKLENSVSRQTELITTSEWSKQKVDDLEILILEKRYSSLYNLIKSFFNRIDEQKEIIKINETIEQLKIEIVTINQKINAIQRELDEIKVEWDKETEMIPPKILKLENILSNKNNEILKYTDGEIIGDGRSDYTQTVKQYTFRYNSQNFAILDLPGIEGREEIVIEEINNAVERAHAVIYISGKAAPPQNGDEKAKGTIEKIKHHLSQQTEVYFVYNKRVKNPRQFKKGLIGEDEKMALKEVDGVLNDVLFDHYKGHQVLSAYPALLSVGNFWKDKLYKNREKFIEQLGSTKNILEDSGVKDFSEWLKSSLVDESKSKIIRSNYRKLVVLIDYTQENVLEIQKQFNSLEKKLTLNGKATNKKLDEEIDILLYSLDNEANKIIRNFKNKLRKKIYDEIEKKIDKDTFKSVFEKEKDIAIKENSQQLEDGIKENLSEFKKEIIEIVSKNERYTAELLKSFDDSAKFSFEFEMNLNIKNSGSVSGTISSVAVGIASIAWAMTNPVGWVGIALATVGMIMSVGKDVLGFFNHDHRISQQKRATNENIEEMAIQLSKKVSESIRKSHKPLLEEIKEVKKNSNLKIKYINSMNLIFQEAERKLKLLSSEIEQEGMHKPYGNN
ncbi:hypothetical protein [Carnobacterium alterfunditum]|uniref:hypothetical protein n=1 Tax=Carnobacterium alterfunditum TaxID=28230 RepID=UPI0035945641